MHMNTWAGQIASHSLQAMQRSSPEGYLQEHHVKDYKWKCPLPEVFTFILSLADAQTDTQTTNWSPAQGMFSSEAGRQWALLKRVVDGGGLSEQVAHCHTQTWWSFVREWRGTLLILTHANSQRSLSEEKEESFGH